MGRGHWRQTPIQESWYAIALNVCCYLCQGGYYAIGSVSSWFVLSVFLWAKWSADFIETWCHDRTYTNRKNWFVHRQLGDTETRAPMEFARVHQFGSFILRISSLLYLCRNVCDLCPILWTSTPCLCLAQDSGDATKLMDYWWWPGPGYGFRIPDHFSSSLTIAK